MDIKELEKEFYGKFVCTDIQQPEFAVSPDRVWEWIEEKVSRVELPVMQKIASIKEQALKGLLTDGGHHKQWFLEAILGMLTTEKEWLYLKEKEQWEEGIAP